MQNSEGAFGNTLTLSGVTSAAEKTMKKGQSLFKLQPFNFLGKQLLI